MPTATTFDPPNINYFDKTKMFKSAEGVATTVPAGTDGTLDLTLADDVLMTAAVFLAKGGAVGDKVDFQVLMGSTVLAQFITNWFINPDVTKQETPQSNYPAKLVAGLTLRVIYHSVGATDVWISVNYNKEKVLV